MIPFDEVGEKVTPASVLDIGKLGYTYDDLPKAQADGGGEKGGSATAGALGPPELGFTCAI